MEKWDKINIAVDIPFTDFDKFNLGLLILLCKKKRPQEDGWGSEGGTVGNIRGEADLLNVQNFTPTGYKENKIYAKNCVNFVKNLNCNNMA